MTLALTSPPKYKAAAIQAAPVFLDLDRSVDKACALIREAGAKGARLIALPETFLPGGPYWAWHLPIKQGGPFSAELFRNSVEVPGPAVDVLAQAARDAQAYVVIGVNERDGKTLYNTLLYFGPEGELLGKHRKFRPTGPEKLVWGDGDGSTHKVYDTSIGKLGGLICGEHTMSLPGYTLAAMGEQVHVGAWLGFTLADRSLAEICSRHHAIAYNSYVLCSQLVVGQDVLDRLGLSREQQPVNAWTAIIEASSGRVMTEPLAWDEEGIVYADIDLGAVIPKYFIHESTGHYWPKPFSVVFDAGEKAPVRRVGAGDAEAAPGPAQAAG